MVDDYDYMQRVGGRLAEHINELSRILMTELGDSDGLRIALPGNAYTCLETHLKAGGRRQIPQGELKLGCIGGYVYITNANSETKLPQLDDGE